MPGIMDAVVRCLDSFLYFYTTIFLFLQYILWNLTVVILLSNSKLFTFLWSILDSHFLEIEISGVSRVPKAPPQSGENHKW